MSTSDRPVAHLENPLADEYKSAILIRNFEIELLWKRIGYYWAFIAATFVAYGTLAKDGTDVFASLVLAHFGFVTTVGWYYFIKGSKYWQQHWEQKLADLEADNGLFVRKVDVRCHLGFAPSRYSVSRITMWYSAVTSAVWLGVVIHEWAKFLGIPDVIPRWCQGIVISLLSIGALVVLHRFTKSGGVLTRSSEGSHKEGQEELVSCPEGK